MAQKWYVQVGGKEQGPFTVAQIKQFAAAEKITPRTPIRMGVDGKWSTAAKVKGLFPEVPAVVERPRPIVPTEISTPAEYQIPAAPPPQVVYVQAPPQPVAAPIQQIVQVNVHERKRNGFATASLVCGCVSLVGFCVPFIGLPAAGLGILFAALGFLVGIFRGGTGIIGSVGGAMLCSVVPLFYLVVAGGLAAGVAGTAAEMERAQKAAEARAAEEPTTEPVQ